jgi:hypothetical protein
MEKMEKKGKNSPACKNRQIHATFNKSGERGSISMARIDLEHRRTREEEEEAKNSSAAQTGSDKKKRGWRREGRYIGGEWRGTEEVTLASSRHLPTAEIATRVRGCRSEPG